MTTPLLSVDGLSVEFGRGSSAARVVADVSFDVSAGECVAIVGESGSGKSVTARSLLGLAGPTATVTADRLDLAGRDVRGLGEREWRTLRGDTVGLVTQDALASLDPLRRVAAEVGDARRLHEGESRADRARTVRELLERVGVPRPELRARQYPHELSGGLRQRALIAAAIAGEPRLLIADEPTTALDMTVQAGILRLLASLTADGMGLLLISHDLGVVARLADRVLVMRGGAVVDEGSASTILRGGAHPYTRALVAAVPAGRPRGTALLGGPTPVDSALQTVDGANGTTPRCSDQSPPLVEAVGVSRTFGTGPGAVVAVRAVSLRVEPGETLGIVGESGSGKTTLGRLLLALERPDSGHVLLDGERWSDGSERSRRPRRRSLGLVSQDTLGALDPRRDVEEVIGDALPRTVVGSERRERVLELMADVGLTPELLHRAPSTLSGGQRQRVGIARALGAEPRLLVLDEPVSALDATVAAGVLDLLDDVQRRRGLAFVFISHDLGVVRHMSDRVAVMLDGRIVEQGPAETVFGSPRHEYTRRLISDVPSLPLG